MKFNHKEPWIGEIPDEWQLTAIKHLVSTKVTDGPHETPELVDDGVQFISAEAIKNNQINFNLRRGFISRELHEQYCRKCKPQRGDIFVIKSGATTGNVAYVDVDFEFSIWSPLALVRCDKRIAFYKFVYYVFLAEVFRKQVELSWSFGTQQNIGMGVIETLKVPLPPIEEQHRIAAYLDASCAAIDEAVTAKRLQLETLDAVRKSVTRQILSEGLRPGLPLKDSGIESIGVIPAHWDVKQMRYACEVNYGITLQLEKGQSVGDGVRILTVSNITIDGNLDLEDEYYIDDAQLTKADYLRRGDLLFNWRNGSQYHVGKTAFFDMEGEVAHVSFLLRIRCGHRMDPFFMRSYLGILKDAGFFSGAKDKVNKTFNSTELKRLRVVIPPMDEQKKVCAEIERRSKECNDVKAAIEAQISTLTAYRKSLIHECVTGQRRITDADLNRVKAHG